MHLTALQNADVFFRSYPPAKGTRVIEIGSQNVNGSLRDVAPPDLDYTGVDFQEGAGVDVVIDDPYHLPFPDDYADVCLSSSCMEHCQFFWKAFLEQARILKSGGLIYMNAPSNGDFHRFPIDAWRFYPDSGIALAAWAQANGQNIILLESYISARSPEGWHDFVAVFGKGDPQLYAPYGRMLSAITSESFANGLVYGSDGFFNPSISPGPS